MVARPWTRGGAGEPGVMRKRRLLAGSVISLAVIYGLFAHGLGGTSSMSTPNKSPYEHASRSLHGYETAGCSEAGCNLSSLRVGLDEVKRENAVLKTRQKALLETIEKSLDVNQLAEGLRDFLAKQPPLARASSEEKTASSGQSKEGHLTPGSHASKQQQPQQPQDSSSKLVMFRHRGRQQYAMIDAENGWLTCNGAASEPMALKTFEVLPQPNGLVALKSVATDKYLRLVAPGNEPSWVFIADGGAPTSGQYLFELHKGGYLFNPFSKAYMNVIGNADGAIRGHGNDPRKGEPAEAEDSASWDMEWVTRAQLAASRKEQDEQLRKEAMSEEEIIQEIKRLPASDEKRVISYGLYGNNPKYTHGALRNAELVDTYFPGWVARFYIDSTVPSTIVEDLKSKGAEIVRVEGNVGKGGIAGMFWRFLVADDPSVDRYIIRDSDSRLNARDRFAVEEWVRSNKSIHSVRDHVNHCRPLNGGLWGGVKGAIKDMTGLVKRSRKGSYGEDLNFLNAEIWPRVQNDQISHDAYCCEQYPNALPFPTKRPANYQHVGQVFDGNDQPRMDDINRFIRGKIIPEKCRRQPDWVYG